jgi:glycosyltransferase involved in cell wall biosynthesis
MFHYSGYLNPRRSNKLVASFHYPPERFLHVTTGTRHLKKLDAAIVVAPNQLPLFQDIIGPEKVHLIPHGIDTHFFRPQRTESLNNTCLFVGSHMRDFEMLKNVIVEITKKDKSVNFKIVTLQKNFSIFDNLKNTTCYSSIPEDQLVSLYNSSTLLLLPVKDGTANNSLLEAMACGLPVVFTKSAGLSYYLNNRCSIEVEPGDVSGMADAVLEISNNSGLKSSMSLEARKKALDFDWTVIAEQTLRLYNKILPENI